LLCAGDTLPSYASIKRLLSHSVLASGIVVLLASTAPAAADFFGIPDQLHIEDSGAVPRRASKMHRIKPHREAKQHESKAKRDQPLVQGPFQIVVAVARQQVTLYDQNGPIAHAAISTGVPAHPTPLGVFTVISKQKWHRSNIYSGAPMPYMQRITWSGIALHAGPLPGYPASHGCIRLPQDFAIRLWDTTKVGTRVIVTRDPVAPVEIAHPKLFVPKKLEKKAAPVVAAAETTNATMIPAATRLGATRLAASAAMTEVPGSIAVMPLEQTPVGEPPPRNGRVSVFVSRKQNRLFVRQGFVPLFDLPLTIAMQDRPLGTHVFTAVGLKDDGAAMRWTVVSIPSGYPHQTDQAGKRAKKKSDDERRETTVGSAPQAASTAAEALDRITLPPEAVERISTLLSPGASLIVSDNALSDETDMDTDFVVLTR
jgi:L,D-transpeptidase catalytic domain